MTTTMTPDNKNIAGLGDITVTGSRSTIVEGRYQNPAREALQSSYVVAASVATSQSEKIGEVSNSKLPNFQSIAQHLSASMFRTATELKTTVDNVFADILGTAEAARHGSRFGAKATDVIPDTAGQLNSSAIAQNVTPTPGKDGGRGGR